MTLVAWYVGLGVAQAALGAWAIAMHPRRLLHCAAGALLILWAGSGIVFQLMRETTDPATYIMYNRVGTYFESATLLLVPLILEGALARGPPPRWRKALHVALGLAVAAAWAAARLLATVTPPTPPDGEGRWGLDALPTLMPVLVSMAITTTMGIGLFLTSKAAASPRRTLLQRRQVAIIGLALALLLAQNALWNVKSMLLQGSIGTGLVLARKIPAILAIVPIVYAFWTLPRPFEGATRVAVVATIAAALGIGFAGWNQALFGPFGPRVIVVTGFVFALALAILRYDVGAPDAAAARRHQAATGVVLAFAGVSVAAGAILALRGATPVSAGIAGVATLAPLALLAVPLQGASSWLGRRVLLDPRDPDVLRERVQLYASTLSASAGADGQVPEAAEPALAALRAQLGLSRRDHELLLALGDARDARGLVAYRLALESGASDASRLAGLRRELGLTDEDHARVSDDVLAQQGHLTEGALAFGRYLVVRRLGSGAFGDVWLARDRRLSRDVVLKRLSAGHRDARALRRVQREVRAAAALTHPHIVTTHDVEALGDQTYLVMEHVAGGSLADALRARGRIPEEEALRIGLDVLAALGALHARGIVHRDVKPANILLDASGRAKLGDFTVARELVSGDTVGGEAPRAPVGTFAYMPPEQARGFAARPASDLYALGATLHEAIAGHVPLALDGLSHEEAARRIVEAGPPHAVPDASPAVAAVIVRALAKAPEERFASAEEMATALEAARVSPTRAGTPAGSDPPRARRPA